MGALLFLCLATACGWLAWRSCVPSARVALASSKVPRLAVDLPAAFLVGTIPITTATFAVATLVGWAAPGVDALAAANAVAFTGMVAGLAVVAWRAGVRIPSASALAERIAAWCVDAWRPGQRRLSVFWAACVGLFAAFAWFVTAFVLSVTDGTLAAGYSVFSDYATHVAAVAAFARGENVAPTTYPHFAGDGIQHHFLFFFLAGNLHYLGLPLDAALNLPSFAGTVAFFCLLGALAVAWSGRRAAFLLAPVLVMLRPGTAGFSYLASGLGEDAAARGLDPWSAFWALDHFIGSQPRDDWGLWNLNVFANQRHLLFGLAAALVVLIVFLPAYRRVRSAGSAWTTRGAWVPRAWRPVVPALLLAPLLGFWHGSVLVALLLILGWLAVRSRDKLTHLAFAVLAVTGSVAMSRAFAGASGGVSPSWQWGFIAEDTSLTGVLAYLAVLTGAWLPAVLLAFVLAPSPRHRWAQAALALPVVFTFTVSLTPDVTVNHKYLMIAIMGGSIPIAGLLLRWSASGWPLRIAAGVLGVALTLTGVVDAVGYRNVNRNVFAIEYEGAFQHWIEENTDPRAIFLTPAWHYHPFFLSGRQAWYGHAYYAWSAGHDTATRASEVARLWSGGRAEPAWFDAYVREHHLDYAIITDTLRADDEHPVDEAWFAERFEQVAHFPTHDNLTVYRLP